MKETYILPVWITIEDEDPAKVLRRINNFLTAALEDFCNGKPAEMIDIEWSVNRHMDSDAT